MPKREETRPLLKAVDFIIPHISVNSQPPEPSEMPFKAMFAGVKLERWDCISAGISFLCLLSTVGFLIASKHGDEMGRHRVDINREMLMYSNDATFIKHMRFMQKGYSDYCPEVMPKYVQPDWEQDDKLFSGFASPVAIHTDSTELWGFVIWIFIWSFIFQSTRGNMWGKMFNLVQWYYPEKGPDFSRWLEYAFTSPAQIFIVNVAFGVGNLDTLLGAMGMQAALVLFGYDIEHQIKKIYKRVTAPKTNKHIRFHGIIPGIRDLRLWIYLSVTWILHTLIWGIPILTRMGLSIPWGIDGRFQLQQYHNDKCEENFKMPWFVDFIFWTQYLLFSSFGCVCTWQVYRAKYTFPRGGCTAEQEWVKYSGIYSFLSITAKTLLEVGFLALVLNFRNWKELQAPTFTCSNHTESSCLLLSAPVVM